MRANANSVFIVLLFLLLLFPATFRRVCDEGARARQRAGV